MLFWPNIVHLEKATIYVCPQHLVANKNLIRSPIGLGIQQLPQQQLYKTCCLVYLQTSHANVYDFALSLKKLTKEHVQPIIDHIADQLPCWKALLISDGGCM
jgi:hypothetical protein